MWDCCHLSHGILGTLKSIHNFMYPSVPLKKKNLWKDTFYYLYFISWSPLHRLAIYWYEMNTTDDSISKEPFRKKKKQWNLDSAWKFLLNTGLVYPFHAFSSPNPAFPLLAKEQKQESIKKPLSESAQLSLHFFSISSTQSYCSNLTHKHIFLSDWKKVGLSKTSCE